MSEYEEILKGVTAKLGYADCSMVEFAMAIRTCVESEMEKVNPDQAIIAILLNAARIGWELIEKSNKIAEVCIEQETVERFMRAKSYER